MISVLLHVQSIYKKSKMHLCDFFDTNQLYERERRQEKFTKVRENVRKKKKEARIYERTACRAGNICQEYVNE